MIKTITIEAVSIKATKKEGTPYMWKDKKTNAMKPRTKVSLKYKDATTGPEGEWLMGWSYKAGSAAEALAAGQTVEIKYEESTKVNPDGTTTIFKGWRFPKQEDKDAALIEAQKAEMEKMKAQLAALQGGTLVSPVVAPTTPTQVINTPGTVGTYTASTAGPNPSGTSGNEFHSPTPVSDGSVPVDTVPF